MPTLADFYASLKTLCDELYMLRLSPRPANADWRDHRPSLDAARAQRTACQRAADACLAALDTVAGDFPDSWRGDDPKQSKYIRLRKSLGTVRDWLYESWQPFRGFKMPMDCDAQDQHDDPADVKCWNDAEKEIRGLGDELKDYIDLHAANVARASRRDEVEPPADPGEKNVQGDAARPAAAKDAAPVAPVGSAAGHVRLPDIRVMFPDKDEKWIETLEKRLDRWAEQPLHTGDEPHQARKIPDVNRPGKFIRMWPKCKVVEIAAQESAAGSECPQETSTPSENENAPGNRGEVDACQTSATADTTGRWARQDSNL